jgi:hypothetical protein
MINDKNSLLGELNIRKTELNVKKKKPQDMGCLLERFGVQSINSEDWQGKIGPSLSAT